MPNVPTLTGRVALSSLSTFDQLCSTHGVPIDSYDDGERSTLQVLIKFRKFLEDSSKGVTQGPARPRGAATPAARGKAALPKARLTFTPSGTPASSQASGGKASSRGSSSAKRKVRALGSDDEDEDGWVGAPSRGTSIASSSEKRIRK